MQPTHELDLSEVILRTELAGCGMTRTQRLALGETLLRDAGRVEQLTLVGDVVEVRTTSALWLVTSLGWMRVAEEQPPSTGALVEDVPTALGWARVADEPATVEVPTVTIAEAQTQAAKKGKKS